MTKSKKKFQLFLIGALGFISIISFQNCGPLKTRAPDDSSTVNGNLISKGDLIAETALTQLPEFCAGVTSKEIVFKLNFGDPLVLDIPLSNGCGGPVKVSRLFVSENTANLFVRLPSEDFAFSGKSFVLEPGSFEDHLLVSNVYNYGVTRLTLNYSLTFQSKSVTVPVNIIVKTEFPNGSSVISDRKITCLPDGQLSQSYTDAFQFKYDEADPKAGQWSPCTVTKCADGYYFNSAGICDSITPPNTCLINGDYSWGSSAIPNCRGHMSGAIEIGGRATIDNVASGYRGVLKLTCSLAEVEKTVSQEMGKSVQIKITEPTVRPDYSIGADPANSTSCQQSEFKGCLAFEDAISIDGNDFIFNVPSIAHGDNLFVSSISKQDPSISKKQVYACLNDTIRNYFVSADYKLPGINISVKNFYQESGDRALVISLWRAEHLKSCLIEVTTSKGFKVSETAAVGPGTYNYNLANEAITREDGDVYIYCTGNESARVFTVPYTGLKK